jgi:uncharacterized protein (TIGR03437 family)
MNAASVPYPTSLGSLSVTFDGIPAPLVNSVVSGSSGFINAQVPFGVLPAGGTSATVDVVVTMNGIASLPKRVQVRAAAPGVFTGPPDGQHNAILIFIDPVDNAIKIAAPVSASASIGLAAAPIPRGQNGFFYATGLGEMTPPVADGSGGIETPIATHSANSAPRVLIGGVAAVVQFAGQAPGFPGINQINVFIPRDAPTGDAVPLQIQTADGMLISTPGATVSIR